MELIKVNLSDLKLREININFLTPDEIESLKNSLFENGQLRNMVIANVGGELTVIDGMKMLRAARELQLTELFALHLGVISERDALLKYVRLNFDKGVIDFIQLSYALRELQEKGVNLNSLSNKISYKMRDIKQILEITTYDWKKFMVDGQDENGQKSLF